MEEETVWLNISWMLVSFNCSWFGPSYVDGGGDGTTAVFTNEMSSAGPCLSFLSWWLGVNGTSGVNAITSDMIEAICCVSVRQIQFFTLFCVLCSNLLHLDCIRIWLAISHLRRTVNKSFVHCICKLYEVYTFSVNVHTWSFQITSLSNVITIQLNGAFNSEGSRDQWAFSPFAFSINPSFPTFQLDNYSITDESLTNKTYLMWVSHILFLSSTPRAFDSPKSFSHPLATFATSLHCFTNIRRDTVLTFPELLQENTLPPSGHARIQDTTLNTTLTTLLQRVIYLAPAIFYLLDICICQPFYPLSIDLVMQPDSGGCKIWQQQREKE